MLYDRIVEFLRGPLCVLRTSKYIYYIYIRTVLYVNEVLCSVLVLVLVSVLRINRWYLELCSDLQILLDFQVSLNR